MKEKSQSLIFRKNWERAPDGIPAVVVEEVSEEKEATEEDVEKVENEAEAPNSVEVAEKAREKAAGRANRVPSRARVVIRKRNHPVANREASPRARAEDKTGTEGRNVEDPEANLPLIRRDIDLKSP